MRLKRLELTGFKSFADRTELEFVPGITAVVGPNGSGKSNISDAIRWVLGEQSAKSLRGAKMEDIIFSGSDSRKPVNYCEVSLTLDNTDRTLDLDYTEVTITRRVYRSGESEYFINKQNCRMKDIVELFMDTGVGKEAYSIIGQGRIDEILSSKSEDRRAIFEEAAGIVKYKTRKKEAEKKLEDTELNLTRVSDVIAEIEEQIGPLEQQAEKAKKYHELKESLKRHEVSYYVHQIETLHLQWNEAKERVSKLQDEQVSLSSEVNRRDARAEQLRWDLNELDKQLEDAQQRLLWISEEVEKKEGQREVLRERKRNYAQNRAQLCETVDKLKQREETLFEQLQQEKQTLEEITARLHEAEQLLRDEQAQYEGIVNDPAADVEGLKDTYNQMVQELHTARHDVGHYEQLTSTNREKRERLQQENRRFIDERHQIEKRREHLREQLDQVNLELETCVVDFKKKASLHKEKLSRLQQLQNEMRQWEQKWDTVTSRRDLLKEMQSDFSGFFQGVKEVLKHRDSLLKGIHGAVAELIQVPRQYEIAVETALGGSLQHVVVENEQAGREAIRFLKERKLGRATFLPLDVIKPRELTSLDQQVLRGSGGVVGIASELVQYENTYDNIVRNLLGSVIICERLEDANRVARQLQYRYRIVTLEGDVVNPGGSMTGGTVKQKNTNLLGRQREIEQLEAEIKQIADRKNDLHQELKKIEKEINLLQEEQEQLRSRGENLRIREQELKGQFNQVEVEKKNVDERLALYDQEKAGYDREIEYAETQLNKLNERIVELEQQIEQKKEEITRAEQLQREKESSREQLNTRITDLKVKVAEVRQQYEAREQNYTRVLAEFNQAKNERLHTEQQLAQLDQQMEGSDDVEQKANEEIETFRREKEELSETIRELREKRQQSHHQLEHMDIENKQFRKQLKDTEDALHKEEVKVNRFDVELDNLLNKLREDYELSYERAKDEFPAPEDVEEAKRKVQQLKQEIIMLGTVNLGAIEEYERVSERMQFLTEQKEDLQQAMDTLYRVIEEMNEEMSRRFHETFQEIRSHFNEVFSRLFGGGRADLQLSQPDQLLHTGVDIVAQPPGKKLQHLTLLSGGEKALTAIALLFSILRVKPVPFCVLDEVEAALDEANVARFAQYLREFSEQTQFIVVTHRKGTMEGSDVLYGITMQESGVSKLVSVRLEDQDKFLNESA